MNVLIYVSASACVFVCVCLYMCLNVDVYKKNSAIGCQTNGICINRKKKSNMYKLKIHQATNTM